MMKVSPSSEYTTLDKCGLGSIVIPVNSSAFESVAIVCEMPTNPGSRRGIVTLEPSAIKFRHIPEQEEVRVLKYVGESRIVIDHTKSIDNNSSSLKAEEGWIVRSRFGWFINVGKIDSTGKWLQYDIEEMTVEQKENHDDEHTRIAFGDWRLIVLPDPEAKHETPFEVFHFDA